MKPSYKTQSLVLLTLGLVLTLGSMQASARDKHDSNYFCDTDCKMEFNFFRKYSHEGSSLADLMLAIMYYQGKGTEVNSERANRYLKKAAIAGETGAEYQLGYFLMYGMYMEQNLDRALVWFGRSDRGGKKGAKDKIAQIKSWQESGKIPESLAKTRLIAAPSSQNKAVAKDDDVEVITIRGDFSYAQVLSAAKDQTCNVSCPPPFNVVLAPLIVLGEHRR